MGLTKLIVLLTWRCTVVNARRGRVVLSVRVSRLLISRYTVRRTIDRTFVRC